jgi:chaperonin GroEL
VITVEESSTMAVELDVTEGVSFEKGWMSAHFATDPDEQEAVLEDALVLIHREKIFSVTDLLPVLDRVVESGKPLLLIAEDMDNEPLSTLVVNAVRKTLRVVAVKAPYFADRRKQFLDDLAVLTDTTVISPDLGLKLSDFTVEQMGRARRVVVDKDSTTIVDGAGSEEAVRGRIELIRKEIQATESDWDREKLEERAAKLGGGIAVIRVGATTETELKERKHRIEDAVAATKAAVEEGIVTGGGTALLQARAALSELKSSLTGDEKLGVEVFAAALSAPLYWIATNAGVDGAVVTSKVAELPAGQGFNAATLTYGDLAAAGIVDPVKVTRSAVLNAASVARMVLTTETAVVEKPAEKADDGNGHHGHAH